MRRSECGIRGLGCVWCICAGWVPWVQHTHPAQIQPTVMCSGRCGCHVCGEDQRRRPRIDPQAVGNTCWSWIPKLSWFEQESFLCSPEKTWFALGHTFCWISRFWLFCGFLNLFNLTCSEFKVQCKIRQIFPTCKCFPLYFTGTSAQSVAGNWKRLE